MSSDRSLAAAAVTLDETSHVYTHADGHRPPSVTQILSSVPPWLNRFQKVDPARLAYKAELGRQVHRATEYLDLECLDRESLDPAITPYLTAWELFRAQQRFVPEVIEARVYHPSYGYAGTLDRIGRVGAEQRVLIDIKTGDNSMAGPQTAAYLAAWQAQHGEDSSRIARWSVRLHDHGHYTIAVHDSREDWAVFQAALTLWTYTHSLRHAS